MRRLCLAWLLLALGGCADLAPEIRWQHADRLASQADWQKLRIPTDAFVLSAYVPRAQTTSDTLTVYIEGDGLAWLSSSQPSRDPTPRNPIGLELALRHPEGIAAYLARPCQYVAADDATNCRQHYWTGGRFAAEVIDASSQAVDVLMARVGAHRLVLVGYSGGGAVATLLAARRRDVVRLVTIGGNLDHLTWTELHHVTPLKDSLNPVDVWESLVTLPQRHLIGGSDKVINRDVAASYISRFPVDHRPPLVIIPGFDHVCCWVEHWPSIWSEGCRF